MLRPFKNMFCFVDAQTDVVGLPHLYLANALWWLTRKFIHYDMSPPRGDLNVVFCFHCSSLNPSWKIIGSWSFTPPLEPPCCEAFNFFRLLDASTLGALKFQQVDDGGWVGFDSSCLWGRDPRRSQKQSSSARNGNIFSVLDVWFWIDDISYLICNYMSGWGGKWDHEPLSGNVV